MVEPGNAGLPALNGDKPFSGKLPVVVLAGGRARRLGGGDKPLRRLAGRSLLAYILERLQPQAGALVINANGDPSRFDGFGCPVIPDPSFPEARDNRDTPAVPGFGPLAGILAALDWARGEGAPAVVTVPGDCPFLPLDLVPRLQTAGPGRAACAASDGRLHPVAGLWPTTLAPVLAEALQADGLRRAGEWSRRAEAVAVPFSSDPVDPFFNINTPADLSAAAHFLTLLRVASR